MVFLYIYQVSAQEYTLKYRLLYWFNWFHRNYCLTFKNNSQTWAMSSNAVIECIFIKTKIN